MSAVSGFLRRRWPAVLLVVSLVANGFLAGMILTDSFRAHRHGFSADRLARVELRRFDDRLPPAAVDRVAAALAPIVPDLSARIDAMRSARTEILQLAAEPAPDRATIDARLDALRAQISAMQAEVQKATYDALLALPPQDRMRLAEPPKGE